MIGIRLTDSNAYLDLDEAVKIPFRIIFPAFSKEIGDNTHTITFDLPATTHNLRMLDNALYVSKYDPVIQYAATIEVSHIPLFRGNIILEPSSNQRISLSFEADISVIAKSLTRDKLQDIDLGGTRTMSAAISSITLRMTIDDPSGICAINVNSVLFLTQVSPSQAEEDIMTAIESQIDNFGNGLTASVSGTGNTAELTISSTGSLVVDLTGSGQNDQTWINIGASADPTIHAEVLAHMAATYTGTLADQDYVFFPVYNPDFYDGLTTDYLGYVNCYDPATSAFVSNSGSASENWRNTAIPFPRVQYLFKQVLAHLGLTDETDYALFPDFEKICLYNDVSLDETGVDPDGQFNRFQNTLDVANHVPDWTCGELINQIRDLLNASFAVDWDKKTALIYPRKEILAQTEAEWRDKTGKIVSISRLSPKERGYLFAWEEDKDDSLFDRRSVQFLDLKIDNGSTDIVGKAPPLSSTVQTHPLGSDQWIVPFVRRAGETVFPDVEASDNVPRMTFFLGQGEMKNSSGTGQGTFYPFGHSFQLDQFGNSLTSWSMAFSSVDTLTTSGIYEYWWKVWLDGRLDQAEVSAIVYLTLRDLLTHRAHTPARLRAIMTSFRVAPKQINLDISQRGIEAATVIGLRL